jgi:hypothetical protein
LHIFESEWVVNQDIIKSIIKSKLGLNKKMCGARETAIREISFASKKAFLLDNHRQGNDNSKFYYGAFYKDKLVGCMTFGKESIAKGGHSKESVFELTRFCVLQGYSIPGLFGKMLKHFIREQNPKCIVSFADRRFTSKDKNVYSVTNFKFVKDTPPNYWYFTGKEYVLFHRFNFRKSELPKKLNVFDPSKSEYENMLDNGWLRIFDCGNLRYELCL